MPLKKAASHTSPSPFTADQGETTVLLGNAETLFSHGLIGIRLLDKNARKGVYLAYKYYMSLFHKIKKMQAQEILVKRIRVSNLKKIMILIYSQIEIRLRI